MLKYNCLSVTFPKLGNAENENEDNVLKASKTEIESDNISRFAISDGATESSFSKEWSELLVSAYKDEPFDKEYLSETLKSISESWQSMVNTKDLAWYAQQKAEIGAFATFLGLTINKEESCFDAVAIGDCALFHIRGEALIFSFPVTSADDFGNTPNLFSSNPKYLVELEKNVLYCKKEILANDILLLATDALAAWIFKEINKKPWKILWKILAKKKSKNIFAKRKSKKKFQKWLDGKRKNKEMKNDDVTLLIIKF
jgi:serine/threonine protein phosphatase PrpC